MAGEEVEESRERFVKQVAVAEPQAGQIRGQQCVLTLGDLEGGRYRDHRAGDRPGGLVAEEPENLAGDLGRAAAAGLGLRVSAADAHLVLRLGEVIDERPEPQFDRTGEAAAGAFADQLTVTQLTDDRGDQNRSEVAAERRLGYFQAGGRGDDLGGFRRPTDLGDRGVGRSEIDAQHAAGLEAGAELGPWGTQVGQGVHRRESF